MENIVTSIKNFFARHFFWSYDWFEDGAYYKYLLLDTKNNSYQLLRIKQKGKAAFVLDQTDDV